jgi:hypothetical protein
VQKKLTKNYETMPLYSFILFGIALFALILYIVAVISPTFAGWFNGTVAAFFRAMLAHLTSWLPFSLAEILLFSLPLLIVVIGIYAYRCRCGSWKSVFVYIGSLLSVFSLFFTLFVFSFGTGYHTETLDRRLSLSVGEVSTDALYSTAHTLALAVNEAAKEVEFGEDGFSKMPYDRREMNDKLLAAYDTLCERYGFIQRLHSRIKPVLVSKLMSYTHITGVYAYFTGEANLNVAFPDYTLPFTAAHELAHQRGIARENEANFIAFLVAEQSDDPYIRYSGYLNLFEYVFNALCYADEARALAVKDMLAPTVYGELVAYAAFFDQYRDSAAANVSDAVNDTYLKLHGNSAGVQSYGLVVELAVAYYAPKN